MPKAFRTAAGFTGIVLLSLVMTAAFFGPFMAPYDPQAFHPASRLEGPSFAHFLGTDQFGRDLLSRLLHGAPSTIFFGLGSTCIGVGVGSVIGVIAGTAGGWIDSVIMRILDGLLAVPELLFTLLIVTFLGGGSSRAKRISDFRTRCSRPLSQGLAGQHARKPALCRNGKQSSSYASTSLATPYSM